MPDHKTDNRDRELMEQFQDTRNERLFQELVERYYASALAVAHSRVKDYALAQDAVQETFVRVVRQGDRYDSRRSFAPWFYTILRNTCTDCIRKQARYSDKLKAAGAAEPRESLNTPDVDHIYETMASLPEGDREVLVLRLIQELSFEDIAEALDCTLDAAKKRAQRALIRLRENLADPKRRPDENRGEKS